MSLHTIVQHFKISLDKQKTSSISTNLKFGIFDYFFVHPFSSANANISEIASISTGCNSGCLNSDARKKEKVVRGKIKVASF